MKNINFENIKNYEMKKKLLYLMITMASGYITNAQTGINNQNPSVIFQVDGNKDNPTTGTPSVSQQSNDFVVTSEGKVGVGTSSPSTILEIKSATSGAIKISDGTQGDRKILTSDANGIGTWQATAVTNVTGNCPSSKIPYGVTSDKYMSGNIVLPKGKWFVFLGFLVSGANGAGLSYASRLTLSSSSTVNETKGFAFINDNSIVLTQTSNGMQTYITEKESYRNPVYGMFASGIVRVEVTSDAATLYLWDLNSRAFTDHTDTIFLDLNSENYFFAIKAD